MNLHPGTISTIGFIVAVIVYFIHACTWEKMIFGFVRKALKKMPDWLKKPLFDCPTCMTIWWGPSILGLAIVKMNIYITGPECVAILFFAAGLNAMIGSLGEAINKKCDCGRKERIQSFIENPKA